MNYTFLTEKEALDLEVGDRVGVVWLSPRKPKGSDEEGIMWQGRPHWLDLEWCNEVVDSKPRIATEKEDGILLKLKNRLPLFNALHMYKNV